MYGAAYPRVVSLTLEGAGRAPGPCTSNRAGGPSWPSSTGRSIPRSLTLVAVTRDGRVHTYGHSTPLFSAEHNRRLARTTGARLPAASGR